MLFLKATAKWRSHTAAVSDSYVDLWSFMIKEIFKNRDFIVIEKPCGMPSQKDPGGDADALSLTAEYLREMGESDKLWLIHRLDRVVGGLMIFARNKESAAELSALVASRDFNKKYFAVAEGRAEGGELFDYVYKDAVGSKAYTAKRARSGVKEARLKYLPISFYEEDGGILTLVEVTLQTGRFHQIRVQFASRKMPLVGDKKYGSRDTLTKVPALFAGSLGFVFKNRKYEFFAKPDTEKYPWCLFNFSEDAQKTDEA